MSTKLLLLAVVMAVMVAQGTSQFGMCNMSVMDLMECKSAVVKPPAKPTKKCCDALAGANFRCFCSYLGSPKLRSYGVDTDLALALPSKCGIANAPTC